MLLLLNSSTEIVFFSCQYYIRTIKYSGAHTNEVTTGASWGFVFIPDLLIRAVEAAAE